MSVVTMKQLLEAGVHFGHQAKRWNPKMAKYIFTERNGIHVIDLHKSLKKIEEAYEEMRKIAEDGGKILFVGTKKQAQEAIKEQAERAGMYYVNSRWLGGMLTNFSTIKKRIERMKELEKLDAEGILDTDYTKKEAAAFRKELSKLSKNLSGIRDMEKVPDAIYVVDVKMEELPVKEAHLLGIPVFAIVDTNSTPAGVDFVIPGNDDATRAIQLYVSAAAAAVKEGRGNEAQVAEELAADAE